MTVTSNEFKTHSETILSNIYGIDTHMEMPHSSLNGDSKYNEGKKPSDDSKYTYKVVLRKKKTNVIGKIQEESLDQPLNGKTKYNLGVPSSSWIQGKEDFQVSSYIKFTHTDGTEKKVQLTSRDDDGYYHFEFSNDNALKDGTWYLSLDTSYGEFTPANLPSSIYCEGDDIELIGNVKETDIAKTNNLTINVRFDDANKTIIDNATIHTARYPSEQTYKGKTDNNGEYKSSNCERNGYGLIVIALPSIYGSSPYFYETFFQGNDNVEILIPAPADIECTGEISGALKVPDGATSDESAYYSATSNGKTEYGQLVEKEGVMNNADIRFVRLNSTGNKYANPICPRCKLMAKDTDSYCSACNTVLNYCTVCQKAYMATSTHCIYGHTLSPNYKMAIAPASPLESDKKKSKYSIRMKQGYYTAKTSSICFVTDTRDVSYTPSNNKKNVSLFASKNDNQHPKNLKRYRGGGVYSPNFWPSVGYNDQIKLDYEHYHSEICPVCQQLINTEPHEVPPQWGRNAEVKQNDYTVGQDLGVDYLNSKCALICSRDYCEQIISPISEHNRHIKIKSPPAENCLSRAYTTYECKTKIHNGQELDGCGWSITQDGARGPHDWSHDQAGIKGNWRATASEHYKKCNLCKEEKSRDEHNWDESGSSGNQIMKCGATVTCDKECEDCGYSVKLSSDKIGHKNSGVSFKYSVLQTHKNQYLKFTAGGVKPEWGSKKSHDMRLRFRLYIQSDGTLRAPLGNTPILTKSEANAADWGRSVAETSSPAYYITFCGRRWTKDRVAQEGACNCSFYHKLGCTCSGCEEFLGDAGDATFVNK